MIPLTLTCLILCSALERWTRGCMNCYDMVEKMKMLKIGSTKLLIQVMDLEI